MTAAEQLTQTQRAALAALDDPRRTTGGVLYAFNGFSRVTAAALVSAGLAEWAPEPYVTSHRRPAGRRTHYQTEWGIRKAAS